MTITDVLAAIGAITGVLGMVLASGALIGIGSSSSWSRNIPTFSRNILGHAKENPS